MKKTPTAAAIRAALTIGQSVRFPLNGRTATGILVRKNPKTALVTLESGESYRVPYPRFRLDDKLERKMVETGARLDAIGQEARTLFSRHGLSDWTFAFDQAASRAGACFYGKRAITMAEAFALAAAPEAITDTLLHEIAHALAGPNHHHDAVWKKTVRAIGGSDARCHTLRFTPPRWIASCENGCFSVPVTTRRRNRICAKCQAPSSTRGGHRTVPPPNIDLPQTASISAIYQGTSHPTRRLSAPQSPSNGPSRPPSFLLPSKDASASQPAPLREATGTGELP